MVVTGGNSGIGEGIVLEAAREGAAVVIDYVSNGAHADELVGQITKDGGRAVAVEADVSKVADLQRLVDAAVDSFGRLDVWVSNAGIEFGQSLLETTEERYDTLLGVNLKGAVFGAKLAAEQMVKQGGGSGGGGHRVHPRTRTPGGRGRTRVSDLTRRRRHPAWWPTWPGRRGSPHPSWRAGG